MSIDYYLSVFLVELETAESWITNRNKKRGKQVIMALRTESAMPARLCIFNWMPWNLNYQIFIYFICSFAPTHTIITSHSQNHHPSYYSVPYSSASCSLYYFKIVKKWEILFSCYTKSLLTRKTIFYMQVDEFILIIRFIL